MEEKYNNYNNCKILDDDEIEDTKNTLTNFRRFEVEELQRKFSPFEKTTHQKKEFPFLFQKKKPIKYEDKKISIEELMGKIESLKVDENKNAIIEDIGDEVKERTIGTPDWPRTKEEFEAIHQEHLEYYANLDAQTLKMGIKEDSPLLPNDILSVNCASNIILEYSHPATIKPFSMFVSLKKKEEEMKEDNGESN